MNSENFDLAPPPSDPESRQRWLQHAAGFILMRDVRRHAQERLSSDLTPEARQAALQVIDDAVYGLMMVIEGVSGGLCNDTHALSIDFVARLVDKRENQTGRPVDEFDLRRGEGFCGDFHGWIEDDFGENPVAVPRKELEE